MAEDYNTEVYREQGTGKIRVKSATRIDPIDSSPTDDVEEKLNQVIALLEAAGLNPEE